MTGTAPHLANGTVIVGLSVTLAVILVLLLLAWLRRRRRSRRDAPDAWIRALHAIRDREDAGQDDRRPRS